MIPEHSPSTAFHLRKEFSTSLSREEGMQGSFFYQMSHWMDGKECRIFAGRDIFPSSINVLTFWAQVVVRFDGRGAFADNCSFGSKTMAPVLMVFFCPIWVLAPGEDLN